MSFVVEAKAMRDAVSLARRVQVGSSDVRYALQLVGRFNHRFARINTDRNRHNDGIAEISFF
jgi:hypothetical protein